MSEEIAATIKSFFFLSRVITYPNKFTQLASINVTKTRIPTVVQMKIFLIDVPE